MDQRHINESKTESDVTGYYPKKDTLAFACYKNAGLQRITTYFDINL